MTSKEREILNRLLIDLFLDHPNRRTQTSGQERRKNNHEKVATHAGRPGRTAGQTDSTNR